MYKNYHQNPEKKSKSSTKRYIRKPAWTAKSIAAIAVKAVEKTAEHKQIDIVVLPTAADTVSSTGGIDLLNAVAEGTDVNTRVGRDIKSMYLEIDLTITNQFGTAAVASGQQFDKGFVSVVLDRQPDSSSVTFNNVYDTTIATAGQALRNLTQNPSRFKVLRHIPYEIANGGNGVFTCKHYIPMYKLGKDANVKFSSTSAGNTISTNALFLCYGSIYTPGVSPALAASSSLSYTARYRFTDL